MATPEQICKEVSMITAELISAGLCIDQNFPSVREVSGETLVGFSGLDDLSITLKNVQYRDAYSVLQSKRAYNFRLIDGGLAQLLYTFENTTLIKHRLAFFPSPDLLEYQNNSEIYDSDELYADVTYQGLVTVPIRFDFDPKNFEDIIHPNSHMTLGQYKNCRIPVYGPLTPFSFISFVLSSFYNTPFRKISDELIAHAPRFARSISIREQGRLHLNLSEN